MTLLRFHIGTGSLAWLARFALIFVPAVAAVSVAAETIMRFDARSRLERIESRQRSRVEIARGLIGQDFSAVSSDLRILSELPALQRYLDHGHRADRAELERYFMVLAGEGHPYDQVRYLDAAGREVIRVNYDQGRAVIVPSLLMQDKSSRYFFRDAIALGPGEIYVSPMDLNVEHGQVEVPYKPAIRFCMSVFDSAGRKRGIVVLNYLGEHLIQRFRNVMHGGDAHESMLLNRDGYWLSSERREDEWGFMLGTGGRSFARDFAAEWRAISASERGALNTDKGLFVFDTVHPLQRGQRSSTGVEPPQPGARQLTSGEYYWKIVSFVPAAALTADFLFTQPSVRLVLAGLYALLALAAGFTAYVMLLNKYAKAELRENEARLREITGTMTDGLLVMDPRGGVSFANPEACQLLGYSHEELIGANKHDLLHVNPDGSSSPAAQCNILKAAQTGVACRSMEETFRRKDGILLSVSVSVAAIARGGEVTGVVLAFHDITGIKRAEAALRKSAEEIEDLYEHAPLGYHSLDANGLIVRINHTELEWLGYSRDELVGKKRYPDLLTPASQRAFREIFPRFIAQGHVRDQELELVRRDGSVFPGSVSATAVRDGAGRFVMSRSTLFDLSERKKLERELQQQARTDALTGLNNRRHFLELARIELDRSKRYNEPVALLMLDIDHFKRVNDTYGHHAGDEVLKKMSERCAHALREIDIAGRLGGEEFAIMLPETGMERALEAAERLRRIAAATAVALEGGDISFTVSIGVTGGLATDADVETLLRRADAALYAAKNAGRNCVRAG